MRVRRLGDGPIIAPGLHPSIGVNIQGPSAIRVPDWVAGRLGAYYLYFADHKGSYIRLAYADHPTGPWTVHPPGSLHLAQSGFLTEPPAVSPEQFAEFEALLEARGAPMSHDLLSEITTPHIASPDVHVDPDRTAHRDVFPRARRCRDAGDAGRHLAATASTSPPSRRFSAAPICASSGMTA